MRLIRIQKIVRTTYDDEIPNIDTCRKILEQIRDKYYFCSFIIEQEYDYVTHPKVRIMDVKGDTVFFRSFKQKATLKDSCEIRKIRQVRIETETEQKVQKKVEVGDDLRWDELDLS